MRGEGLPTGTVTFLLTDISGSTKLWQEHKEVMGTVVELHDEIVAAAVINASGVLIKSKGEGDSTFSVFTRPSDAVSAAISAQRALSAEDWPVGELRVRAAIHTGEAELRDGDYYGTTINRCARLRAIAHGGQTICSQTTADLISDATPARVRLRSLGTHRLKDLERPEQIFQISSDDLPEDFPPLRSLDAFRHNLPTQRTSFIGREEEILLVRKHIEQNRLVTLTGVGGCGKTRLALQAAAELLDAFPDGVYFAELGPVSDPDVIPATVASALGVNVATGIGAGSGRPIRDDLIATIADRKILAVLDNCEHLVEACADLVDEILDRCPDVKVLATSREAFGLEGEQGHPVPSLEVPEDEDVAASEAGRLFLDRAVAVRDGFGLTGDSERSVAQICRRLDGIPLAIELAAAQVAHMSPKQIAERLDDRFDLLTGGRMRVQRQQTLAATLDWSYELLSDGERAMLRRLAMFPGTFSLEAAEAVGCSAATLRSLVTKSMVDTDEGNEIRYRLLETVRLYAEEKVLAAGEAEAARGMHRDYFVSWIAAKETSSWSDPSVLEEAHNLRAALSWSELEGRTDLIAQLASGMRALWMAGELAEGARWVDLALGDADSLGRELRVKLLSLRAEIAIGMLDTAPNVRQYAERVIAEAEQVPSRWLAFAHGIVAFMRGWEGITTGEDVAGDVEHHAELAIEFATSDEALSDALAYGGIAYMNTRDYERATQLFERVLTVPSAESRFPALMSLSVLDHIAGRHERSLELATRAVLETEQYVSDWNLVTTAVRSLALGGLGRFVEAYEEMRARVRARGRVHLAGALVSVVTTLAALATMRGDWERASILFAKSREHYVQGIIRSPAEGVVYQHYVPVVRDKVGDRATELRAQAASMSLEVAIEHGLDVSL